MTTMRLLAVSAALTLGMAEAQAGDAAGDAEAGAERYAENCVNCHGPTGKGMASFPPLIGRDAAYITDRLTTYRAGEDVGPNSAIMQSLVGELTDEEIANLAAYVSETFTE